MNSFKLIPHRRLFVTYGGVHAHIIGPLVREFEKRCPGSTTVLGLTSAPDILRREYGVQCLRAKFFNPLLRDPIPDMVETILNDMRSRGQTIIDIEDSRAYLGFGISGLLQSSDLRPEDIVRRLSRDRSLLWPIDLIRSVFTKVKPTLVVTTNSPRSEQAAQQLARVHQIPSAVIPDLFCDHEHYPLQANRVFVMTEQARKNLHQKYKVPWNNIRITGNPCYEQSLFALQNSSSLTDSGPDTRPIVAWFDQNGYFDQNTQMYQLRDIEQRRCTISTLVQACQQLDLRLHARPHPSQNFDQFRNLCHSICESIEVDDSPTPHQLIQRSSVCLSLASTVLLHAIAMGKPVLQIYQDLVPELDLHQFVGAFCVGESPSQVVDGLEQVFHHLELHVQPSSDPLASMGATQRIIQELEQLERECSPFAAASHASRHW